MDVVKLFTDAFQGHDTLTGEALRYAVMTIGHIATQRLYNNCLDKAMKLDLMTKSKDDRRRIEYRLKTT
jgi:hypothetical protein